MDLSNNGKITGGQGPETFLMGFVQDCQRVIQTKASCEHYWVLNGSEGYTSGSHWIHIACSIEARPDGGEGSVSGVAAATVHDVDMGGGGKEEKDDNSAVGRAADSPANDATMAEEKADDDDGNPGDDDGSECSDDDVLPFLAQPNRTATVSDDGSRGYLTCSDLSAADDDSHYDDSSEYDENTIFM